MNIIIIISILLPLIFSLVLYFYKKQNRFILNSISIGISFIIFILSIVLCFIKTDSIELIKITPQIIIKFSADNISKFFAILFSTIFFIVSIYSYKYLTIEENENKFHTFYMLSLAMLISLCYSANIVTMYSAFEMITLVSMPLVMHSKSRKSTHAAIKYLYYSLGGAFLGLIGIFTLYYYSKNGGNFVLGGALDIEKVNDHIKIFQVVIFFTLIGFSIKAGIFPFHGWLPSAHPVAPSPASAILSGVITKAGVIAIIRVVYYCVGTKFLINTWVQYAFIIVTLISILIGSSVALIQTDFKTRLAYSSISQLSYILLGLLLLNEDALYGSLIHVAAHACLKVGLFLTAGSIIYYTKQHSIFNFDGIGKQLPISMTCYTLLSLGLIGIPPFGAFISKWYICVGALNSGLKILNIVAPVVLLISAILTAAYLLPISIKGFIIKDKSLHYERKVESPFTTIPLIALTILAICIGLFSSEIVALVQGVI